MSSNTELIAFLDSLQERLCSSDTKDFSDDLFELISLVPQEAVQVTTVVCRTLLSRGYNQELFTQLRSYLELAYKMQASQEQLKQSVERIMSSSR